MGEDARSGRAEKAVAIFEERFRRPPDAVAVAPGRVNLIGEHTDYSLLPVLPMAIERGVAVAVGVGPDGRIRGVSATEGPVDGTASTVGGWGRYVAAALAVSELDGGVDVAVEADLPSAGGLASSSALTVATLAALHQAVGRPLGADGLVAMAVRAERALGVAGGEMDQTVIVHGQAGSALRIDFLPPSRRFVPVPGTWSVVVADTGTPAAKAGEARAGYNARVVATRLGAALLAHRTGTDAGAPPVLGAVVGERHLGPLVDDLPERASPLDVAERTSVDVDVLIGSPPLADAESPLPVREVVRHVVSEAVRVDRFEEAMRAGDLTAAGILLDDSQRSLERFGVSTPEIEHLVRTLRAAGAAGCRITGAGFGGHVVALCRPDQTATVTRAGGGFEVRPSDGVWAAAPR